MKIICKILMGLLALLAIAVSALALTVGYTASCDTRVVTEVSNPMHAVQYRCYGGPDVLEQVVVEIPEPEENQAVVRVKAAGVNPLDWHFMRGSPYLMRLMAGIGKPKDQRVGVDFAGVVEKVGSGVSNLKPGDEVFGGGFGSFAEYTLVNANKSLALKPENVSFEQAAAVPVAALTAIQALRDKGKLVAGEKVLINGASGGVGTYAVQIAKADGAEVHGVCSARNIEMVTSLGADHVYDYKSENYTQSGEKYDLIIDMIGNHSVSDNLKVLKDDGRLVIVGGPKGDWAGPLIPLAKAAFMSNFVDQELISFVSEFNPKDLQALADLMATGQVRAVIDRQFSLDQIQEAIAYSESGRARGKIVISVD